jgi:hypothetical protein
MRSGEVGGGGGDDESCNRLSSSSSAAADRLIFAGGVASSIGGGGSLLFRSARGRPAFTLPEKRKMEKTPGTKTGSELPDAEPAQHTHFSLHTSCEGNVYVKKLVLPSVVAPEGSEAFCRIRIRKK